jgi:LuxR family maltose regulon positive regulatory protein
VSHWLCEAEADADNLDDALAGLEAAVSRVSTHTGIATDHVMALLGLAQVHRLRADTRSALNAVATARSVVQQRSPAGGLLGPVSMSEARIRLSAGDGLRAERLLRGLPRTNEVLLLNARLHLLRGGPVAAQVLREFEPATPRDEVEHALLSAWALMSTSPQRAEQHLIRAADVSATHGMTTTLVDVPEPVLDLARRTATYFVHDDLVHLVLVSERTRRGQRAVSPAAGAPDVLLGRGDLQMLALLPSRASNTRIAEELGISVNTVKTRLRRLYGKLEVHDRDAAVARATELGLIAGRRSHS